MNKEELKLNDKELHKCIDELKGTQFLSAFCILDWIIKMRNENEELKSVINDIKHILNNQMDYREFVDIVNDIEEILERVKE